MPLVDLDKPKQQSSVEIAPYTSVNASSLGVSGLSFATNKKVKVVLDANFDTSFIDATSISDGETVTIEFDNWNPPTHPLGTMKMFLITHLVTDITPNDEVITPPESSVKCSITKDGSNLHFDYSIMKYKNLTEDGISYEPLAWEWRNWKNSGMFTEEFNHFPVEQSGYEVKAHSSSIRDDMGWAFRGICPYTVYDANVPVCYITEGTALVNTSIEAGLYTGYFLLSCGVFQEEGTLRNESGSGLKDDITNINHYIPSLGGGVEYSLASEFYNTNSQKVKIIGQSDNNLYSKVRL
jgi:hypothetical protein